MKFLCMLVIYNQYYADSMTYRSLRVSEAFRNGEVEVALIDNSAYDMHNKNISEDHFTYLSMNGNQGLSKAYNAGLDYFKDQLTGNMIVLLDDDTRLPRDYFDVMKKNINEETDVYLPIIYDQTGQLLSPSIMKRYRCVLAKRIENVNEKNINGINTGMMIRGDLFKDYRYDEHYFLDYVDHAFIRDMKQLNKKIMIVPATISQNYSLAGQSVEKALKRFKISKKDISYYYRRGLISRLVYHYLMCRRKAKYFKMYKKINVFFW